MRRQNAVVTRWSAWHDRKYDRLPACLRPSRRPPDHELFVGREFRPMQKVVTRRQIKTGWKPIATLVYSASSNARKSALSTHPRPAVNGSKYDRLPACLRLPSATSRPATSFAAHRISRKQGLIGPTTGWKPILHWPLAASRRRNAPKKALSRPIRAPALTAQCMIGFQPVSGCPVRPPGQPTSFAAHKISRKQGLIGPMTGWKPILRPPDLMEFGLSRKFHRRGANGCLEKQYSVAVSSWTTWWTISSCIRELIGCKRTVSVCCRRSGMRSTSVRKSCRISERASSERLIFSRASSARAVSAR